MTVKMIALDLDGTLLRNDKSIDPSSAEVLRRAQEQGIIITLASGRDKNGCRFVYEPLKLEEGNNYLALVNGQMIYSFARKEYELDDVLDNTDAQKIMKTVKDYDVEAIFCCGYDFYDYISRRRKVGKKLSQLVNGRSGDYGLASGKEHRNFITIKTRRTLRGYQQVTSCIRNAISAVISMRSAPSSAIMICWKWDRSGSRSCRAM